MRVLPLFLLAALAPTRAWAAPEEVQVYQDEMNKPGELGLDVHVNYVASGDGTPDYLGAESSLHRLRITPEFSLGLTKTLELGAYLPLATIARDGKLRVDGAKMRLKFIAPHQAQGFYWGANLEIGRVSHRLDLNPWNSELKLIGGWRTGRWSAAVNANFDLALSGPAKGPLELEVTSKLAYQLTHGFALGLESYNGLGPLRDLGHLASTDHTTLITADTHIGKFDLNLGVGKGYGSNSDSTVVKMVIGVPLK